tara:strand:+ start:313 stop:513 length:201 start_codon:yes stop_codon:yes gene_type:complete
MTKKIWAGKIKTHTKTSIFYHQIMIKLNLTKYKKIGKSYIGFCNLRRYCSILGTGTVKGLGTFQGE